MMHHMDAVCAMDTRTSLNSGKAHNVDCTMDTSVMFAMIAELVPRTRSCD